MPCFEAGNGIGTISPGSWPLSYSRRMPDSLVGSTTSSAAPDITPSGRLLQRPRRSSSRDRGDQQNSPVHALSEVWVAQDAAHQSDTQPVTALQLTLPDVQHMDEA